MAALPEPTAAVAAPDAEDQERHLHAVPETLVETTTDIPVVTDDAEAGDIRPAWTIWLADAAKPQSGLYTDRPLSLAEEWRRAREGAQLSDRGPLRTAESAYGVLAVANKAVVRSWEWVVDHPARMAGVGALVALMAAFPGTRPLLAALLYPFAWAHNALS